jgi:polygalacturonase
MRQFRFLFAVVVLAAFTGCKTSPAGSAERAWSNVPHLLARIVPPTFPARDFVITNYGAVGDGVADCTRAFAEAIAACNRAGGGKVVVPPGVYLTGAIHLKSNVNLHVARGATIQFSTDTKKFLPLVFTRFECTEVMNYSPFIYALDQENIAITGGGTIDGQASHSVWYTWKSAAADRELVELGNKGVPVEQRIFGEGRELRPNFIEPVRCRNVLIEGVRVVDSPMWVLHPLYCTNVTIRGVTVDTKGPNTDGCDPDSCTDVLIKDCNFSDGDDCIAIKSGRDVDGRRVNIPCQNIIIQNCVFKDGHGGVTCGSETAGGIRNVFAENCHFDSTNLNMAIRFKTGMTRGGYIEDVYVRKGTIQMSRVGIHMTMRYSGTGGGATAPVVRNIDIRDCEFKQLLDRPIVIQGFSDAVQITDVTIANCNFLSAKNKSMITNASRVHLSGLKGALLE